MIILAIHGSMRKGNTYRLTKEVISRISSYPDVKIVEFGVADLNLLFAVLAISALMEARNTARIPTLCVTCAKHCLSAMA